jgi:hypothetical protein
MNFFGNHFYIPPSKLTKKWWWINLIAEPSGELLDWALKGLAQIYRAGYSYKKAGIILNQLQSAAQLPLRLHGNHAFERARSVARVRTKADNRAAHCLFSNYA